MTPSPEQSSLVERLTPGDTFIEQGDDYWRAGITVGGHIDRIVCYGRPEAEAVALRDRVLLALERLSQPSDGVTEAMIEKLVREAYEEGVEDGTCISSGVGTPQWIDSVARVNLLRAMRATSSDRSE